VVLCGHDCCKSEWLPSVEAEDGTSIGQCLFHQEVSSAILKYLVPKGVLGQAYCADSEPSATIMP